DERPASEHAVSDGPAVARTPTPPVRVSRRASPVPDGERTSRARGARRAPPAVRRPLPHDAARTGAPSPLREAQDPRRARHADRPADAGAVCRPRARWHVDAAARLTATAGGLAARVLAGRIR